MASFARFTLQLLALGAPPDLLIEAQRASLDEIEHAKTLYDLASQYAGRPLGPSQLSLDDLSLDADPQTIVADLVREGCVGETAQRIPAYSAAKAAIGNFTQWLAVHMAREYSPNIRVNALAPGFFLTEQNRFLLTDEVSDELTPRGRRIIEHTPMGRFGTPEDLLGTLLWLLSPASAFVTGAVIPVDGGFSAFSGV